MDDPEDVVRERALASACRRANRHDLYRSSDTKRDVLRAVLDEWPCAVAPPRDDDQAF